MAGLRLVPERIDVRLDGTRGSVVIDGSGRYVVAGFVVTLDLDDAGSLGDSGAATVTWSVASDRDAPTDLSSIRLVWRVLEHEPPVRLLSHGYQSWSATRVVTLGVDRDPSQADFSIPVFRGWHHADAQVVEGDELRSELVTVVTDASRRAWTLGFLGGSEHDGTFRLRSTDAGAELACEAYLGGAVFSPGEERRLHPVTIESGDPLTALERWASAAGREGGARVDAPYQVGWCSWYHYFHDVTESAFLANLARSGDWPFDVFQLDDGYQATIGDWLRTNEKFPTSLDVLADRIEATGSRPGIWLAPFVARPDAPVFVEHPDWFARYEPEQPLIVHLNPGWGGETYALDTTRPEVLDHLEQTARLLVEAGFTYLKLDFTYAPGIDGLWADRSQTPAQRVRAGYEAVRRGAGSDTFLLGCGAPLGPVVGLVDGMRIGPDVAPSWELEGFELPGYTETQPATVNAWRNTLARSFQHRRLWLNDPDCLMLRTTETAMSETAVRAWADAVALSGGMALVSDDLAVLDDDARALLDRTIAVGLEVDDRARAGVSPRCDDLLEHDPPRSLRSGPVVLHGEPSSARAEIRTPRTG